MSAWLKPCPDDSARKVLKQLPSVALTWSSRGLLFGLLAVLCWVAPAAGAQGETENVGKRVPEKRAQAEAYYLQALEARRVLEQTSPELRVARDYQKVIQAFRRVYHTDPAYGNNTLSLMAIGELYQEMGRRWQSARSMASAIQAYEFLLREYPRSKLRLDARLAVARIYRDDLKQPEEALKQYERYVAAHRRSTQAPQVKDARQAIAELQTELAARKKELDERTSVAGKAETPPEAGKPDTPRPAGAKTEAPAATGKMEVVGSRVEADAAKPPEAPPKAASRLAQVTGVRHWVTPDYTRVVIDVEREVKYGVGRVGNPPRVYVDLYETRPVPAIAGKAVPVEDALLKGMKSGRHQVNVTRVVLYVADLSEYSLSELPNPYRLIVDIRPGQPGPAGAAATSGEAQTPTTASMPPPRPTEAERLPKGREVAASPPNERTEKTEGAKAARGTVFEKVKVAQPNRDGTRSLTRALGLKIGRILLDPGHGGADTGTIGPSGSYEKDLVLDVAQRLGQLIEERLGSEVHYTRRDDSFIPLETRTALANEKQADLFLSIHANSSRSPRARGVETYYLNFTTDPDALEVAARENAVSQERISQLQGLVRKIALQEKVDESREFAARIQAALWRTQPTRTRRVADRGVKKAPFVVLIGANMPSVLAEIAFLSNPQEEKLLRTPEHRQKIALALYSGIVAYAETLSSVKVAGRQTENTAASK